jgi:hypothetical protein
MPTKLGPHSFTAHGDVAEYVKAGSPLVKLVDVFGNAGQLLALNPHLILLGRISEDYDVIAEARAGKASQPAAREFVERQHHHYRLNPLIQIWEGPHEPMLGDADDPENVWAMAWYADFESERLRLLADMGLRGVAGNFASGAPDLPLWTAFLPALDAVEQYNGFLGLHEYASPWLWWRTGTYQPDNCDGSADGAGEGDTGWHTLRYRKVYRHYLEPNGFGNTPLLITECGLGPIDGVCPGMTNGPWQSHLDYWRAHDGWRDPIAYWHTAERDPERYYAEQLLWYDRELQKDSFVKGAAIFTVGASGASAPVPFDVGGRRVGQFLLAQIRAQKDAPTPAPTPTSAHIVPAIGGHKSKVSTMPNLLNNASFEAGQTFFADDTRERAVPVGWRFAYRDETTPVERGQTAPWGKPITALINRNAVIAADQNRIFAGGVFCWKIAGLNAPVWVTLTQTVSGLQRGGRYTFAINILPDVIARTHPRLAYASDPLASEVRLSANFPGQSFSAGWFNLTATPAGRYTRLALDLTAPGDSADLALDVRGRYALPLGAWYVDELSLSPV